MNSSKRIALTELIYERQCLSARFILLTQSTYNSKESFNVK